jgi:hypothetical protein
MLVKQTGKQKPSKMGMEHRHETKTEQTSTKNKSKRTTTRNHGQQNHRKQATNKTKLENEMKATK